MKLGEHLQQMVMHYHTRYYLVPTNNSQSLCSPSPWARPGYFLAKNYFTSGRILMKLGEHLQQMVMHYHTRYYLVPTNTARVCAHQVRGQDLVTSWPRNFTSGRILVMKLHLQQMVMHYPITWFQPTQPEFVLTKSVGKTWLLPCQEILYQWQDLNETW